MSSKHFLPLASIALSLGLMVTLALWQPSPISAQAQIENETTVKATVPETASPTPAPTPSPLASPSIQPPSPAVQPTVPTITDLIDITPDGVRRVILTATPFSHWLLSLGIPIAVLIGILSQLELGFSLRLLVRLLQALGLLPKGKAQGMVYNSDNYQPVAFAVLTVGSEMQEDGVNPGIIETIITDVHGMYTGIQLAPASYRLSVTHQDYIFPTIKKRPLYLEAKDFYKGEKFKVSSQKQSQFFLIPVDPRQESGSATFRQRLRVITARLASLLENLVPILFFLSAVMAILFPHILNILIFVLYAVAMASRVINWFKIPVLTGVVRDEQGQVIERVVVRLSLSGTNEATAVVTTNDKGEFKVYGKKDIYQVTVIKPGYIWQEDQLEAGLHEVDTSKKNQKLEIVLSKA